jgi:hypothetical protein
VAYRSPITAYNRQQLLFANQIKTATRVMVYQLALALFCGFTCIFAGFELLLLR